MDLCHLKNAELEAKHQKYKGRVVLRGDIVTDDSGFYEVFTEQGSQITAATNMDIISRLPGCDGQAADAVSAKTQVKMEDAHKLLKIPKSECQHIWIRLPRHKWPKSWSSMEDPVVLLERNLYGHALAGLLREGQFEKILSKHGWEKVPNWECLFVHRATQWIQTYPCKTKTSQETQRSLQKFLEPERKPKVIYTYNSLEFGKACEDLSWNHCTSTPHRSETSGIAERAVRRVKEGTSAVLLQSGLNESWWADSLECNTYLRKRHRSII